jgi:hypothetical protein
MRLASEAKDCWSERKETREADYRAWKLQRHSPSSGGRLDHNYYFEHGNLRGHNSS